MADALPNQKVRPRIILVGGEKGGTGKTTIACNLAVSLKTAGEDVMLVDTDPQGTSTTFIYFRNEGQREPRIPSVQKRGGGVATELLGLLDRYGMLIVDAGGADSDALRSAMVVADVFIVPVQPSSPDVWTLGNVDVLIAQANALRGSAGKPLLDVRTLINRGPTNSRSRDSEEAASLAMQYPNLSNMMETEIKDRRSFRSAFTAGKGVIEWDDQKAKDEMAQLIAEVFPK